MKTRIPRCWERILGANEAEVLEDGLGCSLRRLGWCCKGISVLDSPGDGVLACALMDLEAREVLGILGVDDEKCVLGGLDVLDLFLLLYC